MNLERVTLGSICLLLAAASSGCCKKPGDDSSTSGSSPDSGASPATTAVSAQDLGQSVTIPDGNLIAGSPCSSVPRITTEELEGPSIHLGSFTIDVYPYPNDPAKTPLTNVTRDDAQSMCVARGRRLCTELEWERACKGPSNTTYEYGNGFDANTCSGSSTMLRAAGSYDKCQSKFGVRAMHGAVWEWTASDWGRSTTAGLATVRGGAGKLQHLQSRCANGQGKSPTDKSADVGFRCCGGPANTPSVNLVHNVQPPIVADASVDPGLAQRLRSALPKDLREIEGVTVDFDKIWRWHPRANEELVLARWVGKRAQPSSVFYMPMVFHICGSTTTVLGRPKGPVEKTEPPATGADSEEISIFVQTGSDRETIGFHYSYGAMTTKQPAWIKPGNTLDLPGAVPLAPPIGRIKLPGR